MSQYYIRWIACAMERSEMVLISGNSVVSLFLIFYRCAAYSSGMPVTLKSIRVLVPGGGFLWPKVCA